MNGAPKPAAPSHRKTAQGLHQKHLIWIIPLGIIAVASTAVMALPKLVSSGYHRATIEALASSLTGRTVHIKGRLLLALLPRPQFIAGDITVTSPDAEVISAPSLTLDIAPIPLLRGQVLARSITLQSPHIALPWPLPGGAAAIAPPRWLTALHANINNGVVSLGGITFTHVSADIFTGSDGAFSVAGSGSLSGYPINLSLGFGALSAVGSTPLTVDIQSQDATKLQAHISGTYDSSSTLSGKAIFGASSFSGLDPAFTEPFSGSADLTADPDQVALSDLNMRQGSASLSGSATLALNQPLLTLLLSGRNLVLPLRSQILIAAAPAFAAIPTHFALDASNTRFAADRNFITIPHLHSIVEFSAAGADITFFNANMPGDTNLWIRGTLDTAGNLLAKAVFSSSGLTDFLAAYGTAPALPGTWQDANLAGNLRGTAGQITFDGIAGNLGPAHVTGTAVLSQQRNLFGALHFDQLDLTPFAAMLRNPPNDFGAPAALDGDFEISADRANINKIPLEHLLIDAALGNRLVVRRLTASLWGGVAAASFTLAPGPTPGSAQNNLQAGLITSGRAILALPSAQPVAVLLPAQLQPPSAVTKAPLAATVLAAGPADALATSASLTLGPVSITAAPSIDLIHQVANGAFTLRHPDAIAAFKAFGLKAGLAWPGAGSIALRADMLLSPTEMGFSDFVLSMGDLTANGALIYNTDHQLNGQIDADTLALPPIPANFTPPWADLATLQGNVALSANRVLWGGNPVLGPATGNLRFGQNRLNLAVTQASAANGVLKGDFSVTGKNAIPASGPVPPAISAKFSISGADVSQLSLPFSFPITLPTGIMDAAADLTASGYAPAAWLATLSGNASIAAQSGTLSGFNLPAIVTALAAKNRRLSRERLSWVRLRLLRNACLTGTTPFNNLSVTGSFNNGIYTITTADLASAAGTATATGSIDLPDTGVTLNATLLPKVPAPPPLHLTIAGTWTAPHKIAQLKQALTWKPPATTK
jgi:uncharacterized protein involved in outer membrane biogenesis